MDFSKWRRSKKHRIGFLVVLVIILALIAFIFEKVRWFMIGLIILVLSGIGLEVFDYDLDLGKLWETGSLQESRVENKNGVRLIGQCVSDDLNCANFDTQGEAQELYNECAAQIEADNADVEDAKSLDVYGLDRDKDGIVCEALPASS